MPIALVAEATGFRSVQQAVERSREKSAGSLTPFVIMPSPSSVRH